MKKKGVRSIGYEPFVTGWNVRMFLQKDKTYILQKNKKNENIYRNHEVTGSNPTPVRFQCNVSALSELSINCTMAWVADKQVRAILYATLAVS